MAQRRYDLPVGATQSSITDTWFAYRVDGDTPRLDIVGKGNTQQEARDHLIELETDLEVEFWVD